MAPLEPPVLKEPYYALVMQRFSRDIGSMFRRHISQVKLSSAADKAHGVLEPSGHPAFLKRQISIRARPGLERRGSRTTDGPIRYGWDVNTVVWIGSHLLKALENIHNKGYIHRDIVNCASKLRHGCPGLIRIVVRNPKTFASARASCAICYTSSSKRLPRRQPYLAVDFAACSYSSGMAKAYRSKPGAHLPKPSEQALCVGTQAVRFFQFALNLLSLTRYCWLSVHEP